jgi:hypothetical protein
MIQIIFPSLPVDILNIIWEYHYVDPNLPISEKDMTRLVGHDRFVDKQKVSELIHRFSNMNIPYMHCDNLARALSYLSPGYSQKFYNSDAVEIMNVIMNQDIHHHTIIAFQKVFVLLTLNSTDLPNELFGIGKCYYGGRLCKRSMSDEQILKNLKYNDSLSLQYLGFR